MDCRESLEGIDDIAGADAVVDDAADFDGQLVVAKLDSAESERSHNIIKPRSQLHRKSQKMDY